MCALSRIDETAQGVQIECAMSSKSPYASQDPVEETARFRAIIDDQCREIAQLRQRLHRMPASHNTQSPPNSCHDTDHVFVDDRLLNFTLPALMRGLTTKQDVILVSQLCKKIVGTTDESIWHPLVGAFYDKLATGRASLPPDVLDLEHTLIPDWFRQPWYMLYVQQTALEGDDCDGSFGTRGDFDTLRKFLPFIRNTLGFQNVCLLPHYESPMADGGNDVSAYTIRESLGGVEAFQRFMTDATALGVRVGTDAVINHTSTEHDWFQRAVNGESKYLRYYVLRNGREKIAEYQRDGEIICQYRDPDGTTTERKVMIPDIDRTHGLWVEINRETYQFYRTFHPHQVDLNLRNPDVLVEIFKILAAEVACGVLCKRMTTVSSWIKVPGEADCEDDVCHAVLALLKMFVRLLHARTVVFADVVHDGRRVNLFAGKNIEINGESTTSGADGLSAYEMQRSLYECICLQTTTSFWKCVFAGDDTESDAVWINMLESHDHLSLRGYIPPLRGWLCDYIRSHGGAVFHNGLSAAVRLGDLVSGNEDRAATGLFLLYIAPGVATVYAGSELCVRGDWAYAKEKSEETRRKLQTLGVYVSDDASFDRRELQRGPLLMGKYMQAVERSLATVVVVQTLNKLFSSTFIRRTISPVDSDDIGVLAAIIVGSSDNHDKSVAALAVANLTPLRKILNLPARQLRPVTAAEDHQSCEYLDMLTQESLKLSSREGSIEIDIAPYGRYLLTQAFEKKPP